MKKLKIKEMKKPKDWDEYSGKYRDFIKDISDFQNVSREDFEMHITLNNDVSFVYQEGETIETWIDTAERCGDLKFQLSLHKGHVIGCIRNMGTPIYFTPNGLEPSKIPDITKNASQVIKYVSHDAFDLDESDIPGMMLVHGTDKDALENIMENGISPDYFIKGNLGKSFYVSSNYKLSMFNYASQMDETENKTNSGLVLLQVKPGAKIIGENHPIMDEVGDQIGKDNFGEILEELGVDGIFVKAYDAVAIYNKDAVKVLNSFITKDVMIEHKKEEDNAFSL